MTSPIDLRESVGDGSRNDDVDDPQQVSQLAGFHAIVAETVETSQPTFAPGRDVTGSVDDSDSTASQSSDQFGPLSQKLGEVTAEAIRQPIGKATIMIDATAAGSELSEVNIEPELFQLTAATSVPGQASSGRDQDDSTNIDLSFVALESSSDASQLSDSAVTLSSGTEFEPSNNGVLDVPSASVAGNQGETFSGDTQSDEPFDTHQAPQQAVGSSPSTSSSSEVEIPFNLVATGEIHGRGAAAHGSGPSEAMGVVRNPATVVIAQRLGYAVELESDTAGKVILRVQDSSEGVRARLVATSDAGYRLLHSEMDNVRQVVQQAGIGLADFSLGQNGENPFYQEQKTWRPDALNQEVAKRNMPDDIREHPARPIQGLNVLA